MVSKSSNSHKNSAAPQKDRDQTPAPPFKFVVVEVCDPKGELTIVSLQQRQDSETCGNIPQPMERLSLHRVLWQASLRRLRAVTLSSTVPSQAGAKRCECLPKSGVSPSTERSPSVTTNLYRTTSPYGCQPWYPWGICSFFLHFQSLRCLLRRDDRLSVSGHAARMREPTTWLKCDSGHLNSSLQDSMKPSA